MRTDCMRIRLFAVLLLACGCLSAADAAGVAISTNYTAYRVGDKIRVQAHADALQEGFDAWAVLLAPGGAMYFMSLAGTLAPGPMPIGRSVPGLRTGMDATLLSMFIPNNAPRGEYEAVLVFLPAGTSVSSVEDAEKKAIPGCFARARFYLISGRIRIDIDGAWDVNLEGVGTGLMTIARYPDNFIVGGDFTGYTGLGNASVLGFIDLDTFTLFLNFADKPGKTDMTLKGKTRSTGLYGTFSSDAFTPDEGPWTAGKR